MASQDEQGRPRARRLSRRGFLVAAGGAAVGSAGLALGACGDNEDSSAGAVATVEGDSTAVVKGPVEQQRQRRTRLGLTGWDPSKTFDGLTLFSPLLGSAAHLIDMEGQIVHTWEITEPGAARAVWSVNMLENGNILAFVHDPEVGGGSDAPPFVFKGGIIMELAWDGSIVWQVEDPDAHHDARMLPNGNLLILRTEAVPPDIAAQLQGGVPGTEGTSVWADWVAEVTPESETVWEWHAWEHLDPAVDIRNAQDTRQEWTHGNSVDQLPNGDALVSFRNINTVVIVNRESGEITWKLTAPTIRDTEGEEETITPSPLAQQHDASVLPNGNILIFDNGSHRIDNSVPFSRAIEVDPATSEIVWKYQDFSLMNFVSPFISGVQRLPNGNTLITEGNFGRIFEVTTEGELVWEYISDKFVVNPFLGENNSVFRAYRYPEDAFQRT